MDAVVIVETDERVVCTGIAVVVGVFDPLLKPIGFRYREDTDAGDSPVSVGFDLVFDHRGVTAHPCVRMNPNIISVRSNPNSQMILDWIIGAAKGHGSSCGSGSNSLAATGTEYHFI